MGLDWLLLCQKYSLRDLGWFIAYDLGTQVSLNRGGAWILEQILFPDLFGGKNTLAMPNIYINLIQILLWPGYCWNSLSKHLHPL